MGVCRKKCGELGEEMSMRLAAESGEACEELGLESL